MARYRRSTRVRAPMDEVWSFHSSGDGLVALTPGWMNLRIDHVTGPDGEPDPDRLEEGAAVHVSIRPLGIGPPQSWTSRIVERTRSGDGALFRDEMVDGPFRSWIHTHRFLADGDATIVEDDVVYELPRPLGGLSVVARVGLAPMFAFRHRRTRALLGDGPRSG